MNKIKTFFKNLKAKQKICLIGILIAIIFISILTVIVLSKNHKRPTNQENLREEIKEEAKVEPKVTIIDENSNTRPFAVMINNHPQARAHHAGLQDAYMIYEIIVEGGLTRYLALYKDQTTEKIGSVRSSRHYFLDYAMENDAMYVHWGWSPQAQSDISTYKINNINGLTYEGTYFYRDRTLGVSKEHTGFTNMELLNKAASKLNYRTTTNQKALLNYIAGDVDLSTMENTQKADTITIRYSQSITDKYVYDAETKTYKRYVNNKEHIDDVTKKQYTFKNIITYQVGNNTISGDEKGRQDLGNVGSGEGYYITNGYAIKIKWSKESRDTKTKYTLLDGTELKVSDGNTFIQIQPKNQTLTIEQNIEEKANQE